MLCYSYMQMARLLLFFALLCTFFIATPNAQAQVGQNVLGSGSELQVSPAFPEPGDAITISVNNYSLNTQGAQYRWYINGVENTAARNSRSVTLQAGPLGDSAIVRVDTTLATGATISNSKTITITQVDMLVEADTLVPSFYKGLPLPSSGSVTRVTAIPFLGAGSADPSSYSYTWKVGDTVVSGGSQYGKNSVTFTSGFQKSIEVSVDIYDNTGALVTKKTTIVPIAEPALYFYEVNPLSGIIERTLGKGYIMSGQEMTVRAEPYFMDRRFMLGPHLTEWKLNNTTITNPSDDEQEIVLRRSGQSGSFTISYQVRNLSQLLQGTKGSVTINF